MKEYTYTNKAYLGIKEGVVPPAPQYLWLNSEDNKLYKFGDGGWEVIDNAPYVVEEFTAKDLASLAFRTNPVLTISRDFLDAMYKGLPIMVKAYSTYNMTVPLSVDTIGNPSNGTQFIFRVKFNNTEYTVTAAGGVITDTKVLSAVVTARNLVDWNENDYSVTGYIANRTHYPNIYGTYSPGQRFAISDRESTHNINNYRLLIRGELFKIQEGKIDIQKGDATLLYNCVREENGNVVIWDLYPLTYTGLQANEKITVVSKLGNYKALDEFYLPDTVKDAISTTYNELKTLRDNNELKPGTFYRITDYITTTVHENTSSAGHPFDVIVLALSDNTLSEEAYAIKSARDTDKYFGTSNLSAWKIWYSLDNDTNRFGWADAKNGTGVIYRMIDEWNNDVPYDFKNILYDSLILRVDVQAYGSYFTGTISRNENYDINFDSNYFYGWDYCVTNGPSSVGSVLTNTPNISFETIFYDKESLKPTDAVKIKELYTHVYTFGHGTDDTINEHTTVNNVIMSRFANRGYVVRELTWNIFGSGCRNNTIGSGCIYNNFGSSCNHNVLGNNCTNNKLDSNCSDNTFGNNCTNNTLSYDCQDNIFSAVCSNNTLSFACNHISFKYGNNSSYNFITRETPSTVKMCNFVITNVGGSSGSINKIIIPDNLLDVDYEIKIAKNSSGEIKMYCEADLVE